MPNIDLREQKLGLNAFLQQGMPFLVDFIGQLGFPKPSRVLNESHFFIRGVSDWISHQQICPTDRAWQAIGNLVCSALFQSFQQQCER